jgi:hypothetical protein
MDAFDNLSLLQLGLWNATNAICSKVGISCLDAPQATQVFISLLFPLSDQVSVGNFILQTVIVEI